MTKCLLKETLFTVTVQILLMEINITKVLIFLKPKLFIIKNAKNLQKYASIIHIVSSKCNLTKDIFTACYDTIISKVEERISHLMVKFKFH